MSGRVDAGGETGQDRDASPHELPCDLGRRFDSLVARMAGAHDGDGPAVVGDELASHQQHRRPVVDHAEVRGVPVVRAGEDVDSVGAEFGDGLVPAVTVVGRDGGERFFDPLLVVIVERGQAVDA